MNNHAKKMPRDVRRDRYAAFALAWCCAAADARAQSVDIAQLSLDRLADISLEQLSNIRGNHAEFGDVNASQVRRAGWVKLMWRM